MTELPTPLEVLRVGVDSFAGLLAPEGGRDPGDVLRDPVFRVPTQYGSAYYAWSCAVLGERLADGEVYRDRAAALLAAAARHTAEPGREPHASGFDRRTLSVTGRLDHRDFTWPPILKTWAALGSPTGLRSTLAGVQVEASFRSRPPSNWAAVWLSGEWLRMRAGLSPTSPEQLDRWLDVFFAGGDVGLDLHLGMYTERGLPEAYDLFTRVHLTDLLLQGYAGRHREPLLGFLTTGLRRSLTRQLSDGSLASGYRSTGQTWVLGAQVLLFTASRLLGLGSAGEQEAARLAAWRAFASLAEWQRPDGYFSPVQNLLPPELRVGYENYTADGHYSPLALGFLASAVVAGFGEEDPPSAAELDDRPGGAVAEGAPTHRGAAHRGRVSLAVQAQADDSYDATGLVDLTFGSGRRLGFVSAARHLSGGPWLVPGLGLRAASGAEPVTAVGGLEHVVGAPLQTEGDAGLRFETTFRHREGSGYAAMVRDTDTDRAQEADTGTGTDPDRYRWRAVLTDTGVEVEEAVPGWTGWLTLLVPYLRDLGSGTTTEVSFSPSGIRFTLGTEWVELHLATAVERAVDLPYGYENRRGLCGLVRLDLVEPGDTLHWSVTSSDS